MAFDPKKWDLSFSKEEVQCRLTKSWHWISADVNPQDYNPQKAPAYFPDITNQNYQKLLLNQAKRQIDLGADGIWIDMLFKQAIVIKRKTGDPNHPGVKESFTASSKIVNEIHQYGQSKGKYIYVGTWWGYTEFPDPAPMFDFVTATPSSEEISAGKLDENKWSVLKDNVIKKSGDIPIFVFIDFGNDGLPLATFSQELSKTRQKAFLKTADDFFQKVGMIFVYPMHGGFMGLSAGTLSFGKYKNYDSLAPEFDTYGTIRALAKQKASK